MKRLAIPALVLVLAGCSGPLKLLTGGGPNVAASVPITSGETATNGVGVTTVTTEETRLEGHNVRQAVDKSTGTKTRADRVEQIQTNHYGAPAWLILALALAVPSPLWAAVSWIRRRADKKGT